MAFLHILEQIKSLGVQISKKSFFSDHPSGTQALIARLITSTRDRCTFLEGLYFKEEKVKNFENEILSNKEEQKKGRVKGLEKRMKSEQCDVEV